jgi:hypothetical protein
MGKNNKRARLEWNSLWLPAWALVGCGMYSLVWAHWRYVGAFLLLLCLAAYRALIFRVERRMAVQVCAIALLVAMAPLALSAARALATTVKQFQHPVDEDYVAVAKNLQRMGLQPGDKLATIGNAGHPYFARYDRLRVIAQVEDADEFWQLTPADAKRVEDRLASIGVKALMAFDLPAGYQEAGSAEAGWAEAGTMEGKHLSVLLLQPVGDAKH